MPCLAPLPAKRLLWEAGDEFIWKKECEKSFEAKTVFGMAANGDLVRLGDENPLQSRTDAVLFQTCLRAGNAIGSSANWEE